MTSARFLTARITRYYRLKGYEVTSEVRLDNPPLKASTATNGMGSSRIIVVSSCNVVDSSRVYEP